MNITPPQQHGVAFYSNMNRLKLDREIDFTYEVDEEFFSEWRDQDEVVLVSDVPTYQKVCREIIGKTTRILFLPKETSFGRAIIGQTANDISYKPTGGRLAINGLDFLGFVEMGDYDTSHHGLAYMKTDEVWSQLGDTPSTKQVMEFPSVNDCWIVDAGTNAALFDIPGLAGLRIAPLDFIEKWLEEVINPIEADIKACAYAWTGDGKTNPGHPYKVV